MELRQLRYFVRIVELGSMSRAALDGMSAQMGAAGVDLGALEAAPGEDLDEEAAEEANA